MSDTNKTQATDDISLGEKLGVVIQKLPSGDITFAEIRDLVGQDGLLFLCALLTLVFMIPVSIPGVSTVFGAAILMIGVSRLFKCNLWLPKQLSSRKLSADKIRSALQKGVVWFHRLEKITRPHRWSVLTHGSITLVNDLALILGALLLMAPFGSIPFTNTIPALAVLLLAIGTLQRDGICVLLGHFANLGAIVYFYFLIRLGVEGVEKIRELIQRLFN